MQVSDQEDPESSRQIPFFTNLIATGLFAGYIPWASGTFGTFMGILIYLLPGAEHLPVLIVMIVAGFFVGAATSSRVADIVGHRLSKSAELAKATFQPGNHNTADPSIVVIDEIVGTWITLVFLPKTVFVIVVAFFAFRVFDIVKPPPARQLEQLPDGWGIMLDDVVAGIYANVAVQILYFAAKTYFPTLLSM